MRATIAPQRGRCRARLLALVVSLPVVGAIVVGAVVVSLGAMFLTRTGISAETAGAPLAMAPTP